MSSPPISPDANVGPAWKDNFSHKMTPKDYLRMIVIVGAYLLLRPFLVKLGARQQRKVHEREAARTVAEATDAALHPNQLRGGKVEIPGLDDSDEENIADVKPANWGRNARVRQRKFVKDTLAKEEERLRDEQEAESDKELERLLDGLNGNN
ncbi:protein trafficking Pga2 [Dendryphion nanum]|uniref:Protein trafficking Pga2 n=1 Tax=Dendryphion nanum TaxID=256645 RepID=A0A9P9DNL9_9PLEO|nr:protein trafficking Pga2 [Dendryphion nanum]